MDPVLPEMDAQNSLDLLAALTQIQSAFISNASLSESFNNLLTVLLRVTDSAYGFIGEVLHRSDGQPYLKTHAITNIAWDEESQVLYKSSETGGMHFYNLKTLFGAVMVSGQTVIANDPRHDPRRGGLPPGHPPLNAFLGLPLFYQDELVGMIGVGNRQEGYNQAFVDYLNPMLMACATLIQWVRNDQKRYENETALENYANRLHLLHEIDKDILAAGSPVEIARTAVHFIRELIPSDRATVVLDHPDQKSVEMMAIDGLGADTVREHTMTPITDYPPLDGLAGGEIRYIRALNENESAPVFRHLWKLGVRSFMSLPLFVEGSLLGTLNVSSIHYNAFDSADINTARAMADQVAMAMQHSLLRERINQQVQEMEDRIAERTNELLKANSRLRELDELKNKFVSEVSHELRNPLTSLNIRLDLLERSPSEQHGRHIALLKEQVNHLNKLVETILDLSRLDLTEADKIAFIPVDFNAVIEQVFAAYEPLAEASGLALIFTPGDNLPWVNGETNQLAQVITNLVVNAINYTLQGSVNISTGIVDNHVYLRVQDTGIGIPDHDLPHIFERFFRGKHAGLSQVRGTGLGLGIVKEIVDLHGGQITVESVVNQGTNFTVYLPVHE